MHINHNCKCSHSLYKLALHGLIHPKKHQDIYKLPLLAKDILQGLCIHALSFQKCEQHKLKLAFLKQMDLSGLFCKVTG